MNTVFVCEQVSLIHVSSLPLPFRLHPPHISLSSLLHATP